MKFGQLLLKVLNISKHELGRVVESWLIRLCYQTGYVICFTALTAIIVNEFGIAELPFLYIANALIMIIGSFFYSFILRRLPHKGIIITSIILAVATFLGAIWMFADNIALFLVATLFSLSFFVGQIYIFLLAWIEELFSPNENQRANPLIETSEPIGGIAAGTILVLFAGKIPIANFMYFTAGFLFCIVPLMVFFLRKRYGKVTLVLPEEEKNEEHHGTTLQKGFHHLKAIPFVRGLAIVIMLQWVFINMVNFQYTKALDANVSSSRHGAEVTTDAHKDDSHGAAPVEETKHTEQTSSADTHATENTAEAHEDVLVEKKTSESVHVEEKKPDSEHATASAEGHEESITSEAASAIVANAIKNKEVHVSQSPAEDTHSAAPIEGYNPAPQHSSSHEDALTHGLGTLHIIFSILMLFMQLFFSSRVVTKLGIVRSMQLLPGLSLVSAIGMFLNFNFATAVVSKAVSEMFLVVSNNSYHNAYYAISEHVREQIREFLEGIVRPLGVILGTSLLLFYQMYMPSQMVDNAIILSIIGALVAILIVLTLIRGKYTQLAKKNMDMIGDHPEKLNAIEILSQKGHTDASTILTKNLIFKKESPKTKVKILKSLAIIKDIDAMPEILSCLSDEDPAVQVQACKTLTSYKQLGRHFYTQAFARHRVLRTLKELFRNTTSPALKAEIMQVFSNIHHEDIVDFLIELLESESDETKADLISIIGMFNDINSAHYIEKYLESSTPAIKANTIIALWQFKKYRLKLLVHLMSLLDDEKDIPMLLSGIHVLGETKSIQEIPRLLEYLRSDHPEIQSHAAIALAKIGVHESMDHILNMLLHEDRAYGASSKQLLQNIEPYYIKMLYAQLEQKIYEAIHELVGQTRKISLRELTREKLELLQHYFYLLEHEHNLMKIENMLKKM